jgi:CRP-like cAMP-binding protein
LTEGNFVTSFTSFFDQTMSRSNTITTEDSILLEVSFDDFMQAEKQIPGGFQLAMKNALIRFSHFLTEMTIIQKTESTQRYEYLMARMPQIPNRFQLKQQASFLGMKPETLSRIRNTFSQQ